MDRFQEQIAWIWQNLGILRKKGLPGDGVSSSVQLFHTRNSVRNLSKKIEWGNALKRESHINRSNP